MGKTKVSDIVTNVEGLKGDTFEGTIDNVSITEREVTIDAGKDTERKEDREYIHIELEVPFMKDDLFNVDFPVTDRSESGWGYFLKALKDDCGLEIEKLKDLEGLKLEFERRPIILASGFQAKKDCPMPIADLS